MGQTPDTDLNQHVRREYTAAESADLIAQMRDGIPVPSVRPETSVETMVVVLSSRELHLRAADGYKKTGTTVALDGHEDHLICREAGRIFRELNMAKNFTAKWRWSEKKPRQDGCVGRVRTS